MFRQLIIFHKGDVIFNYTLAKGLGMEELGKVQEMLENYIEVPSPGKTFKQPISDHMIYHQGKGNLYFIFVADLVDKLDYFQESISAIIKKFKTNFPIPETVNESPEERAKFVAYLYETQKSLLSKIAIMGAKGAGRSTLFNLLKSENQSPIMNFALKSSIKIDKLYFELWDFQLDDNFSLLWSKHIGGSDLIIFVFDASNYKLKVLNYFLDLAKKESKYSKLLILANKVDLIDEETLVHIKNELEIEEINPVTLKAPDAEDKIKNYIRDALDFKRKLPDNFQDLRKQAKNLENEENLKSAIQKYEELLQIANNFQNFSYVQKFEDKLEQLKKRRDRQIELQKELKRKKKFSAPDQKKFTGKIKVKSLPDAGKKTKKSQVKKPKSRKGVQKKKSPKPKLKKKPKTKKKKLSSEDIQINIPRTKKPQKIKKQLEKRIEELKKEKDQSVALQKLLEIKDTYLDSEMCKLFVKELQENLNRPLSFGDIKIAADKFINHEKGKGN